LTLQIGVSDPVGCQLSAMPYGLVLLELPQSEAHSSKPVVFIIRDKPRDSHSCLLSFLNVMGISSPDWSWRCFGRIFVSFYLFNDTVATAHVNSVEWEM